MKCNSCNSEIPSDSSFCPNCGKKVLHQHNDEINNQSENYRFIDNSNLVLQNRMSTSAILAIIQAILSLLSTILIALVFALRILALIFMVNASEADFIDTFGTSSVAFIIIMLAFSVALGVAYVIMSIINIRHATCIRKMKNDTERKAYYKDMVGPIIFIIANALFGGIVGIIGSGFNLAAYYEAKKNR